MSIKNVVFALVALVALVATVTAVAPLQLSGNVGMNISENLTDDNAFMNQNTVHNGTSVVIVFTQDQAAAHGGNHNAP